MQLASVINTHFLEAILRTPFSEWGALLLHQEVLSMIRIFDDACDDSNSIIIAVASTTSLSSVPSVGSAVSAKEVFSPLSWGLKVLTLDQPVDIKKYSIPQRVSDKDSQGDVCTPGLLSEYKIRKIMCNRVDFSKDAAMKVKITIK